MKTAIELQHRELELERASTHSHRATMTGTQKAAGLAVEHDDPDEMGLTLDFSAQALRCSLADFAGLGSVLPQSKK